MELIASRGKGYRPAEKNKSDDSPLGLIAIDSLFSPVKKVSYTIENAREGKSLDYDYGPGAYKMTLRFDETAFITSDLIWSELNDDQNRGTGVFGEEAPRFEFDAVTQAALNELANK